MRYLLALLFVVLLSMGGSAWAAVPHELTYAGELFEGDLPFEGEVDLLFEVYDAAEEGALLWSEAQLGVVVTDGRFTAPLSVENEDLAAALEAGEAYLEVIVDDEAMLPRVRLGSMPYAYHAGQIGALSAEELQATLAELRGDIESLQGTNASLRAELDTLTSSNQSLQSELEELQADHEALAGQVNESTLNWSEIVGKPAWLGDDAVSWTELIEIPADFADNTDDGLLAVDWSQIANRPAGLDDGDDVGLTAVDWSQIANRPAGLDDGDDLGLESVSWDDILDTTQIQYDGTDFVFSGLNVHVQNGTGSTLDTINGLGNLVIGYDEEAPVDSSKTGSHNLIVGMENSYTGTGNIVSGRNNSTIGNFGALLGGSENQITVNRAVISGGTGLNMDEYQGWASPVTWDHIHDTSEVQLNEESLVLSGLNLYVQSGSGSTSGTINGLGNVIIGYDEGDVFSTKTGSHNLVVGVKNSYTSYGGIIAGYHNAIEAPYTAVLAGHANTASGKYSAVIAGWANLAGGETSSVLGGYSNEATGEDSTVSGGSNNDAEGKWSSISGGSIGTVTGYYDWQAGSLFEDD